MKQIICILTTCLYGFVLCGQTFVGVSDNMYNCIFRVNQDSTANFIYDRNKNAVYGEYMGTIKRLNDTLYHVQATMTAGQFYMKAWNTDTIYIQLDSTIARQLDQIQVEYSDGEHRVNVQGYDNAGKPINLLKIPIDETLFNESKGTDYVAITTKIKNHVTDKFVSFNIPFGSAAFFTKGHQFEFNVIIKNGFLWTTGHPLLQTGHFKLKKKSGT